MYPHFLQKDSPAPHFMPEGASGLPHSVACLGTRPRQVTEDRRDPSVSFGVPERKGTPHSWAGGSGGKARELGACESWGYPYPSKQVCWLQREILLALVCLPSLSQGRASPVLGMGGVWVPPLAWVSESCPLALGDFSLALIFPNLIIVQFFGSDPWGPQGVRPSQFF